MKPSKVRHWSVVGIFIVVVVTFSPMVLADDPGSPISSIPWEYLTSTTLYGSITAAVYDPPWHEVTSLVDTTGGKVIVRGPGYIEAGQDLYLGGTRKLAGFTIGGIVDLRIQVFENGYPSSAEDIQSGTNIIYIPPDIPTSEAKESGQSWFWKTPVSGYYLFIFNPMDDGNWQFYYQVYESYESDESDESESPTEPSPPPGGGIGCPYLSTWNGTGYERDNVILIDSEITKNKTITDYMKVENHIVTENEKYSFQISESERERTKLDSIELMTIDHPENVDIAMADRGQIVTYSNPTPPLSCVDKNGDSVLYELSSPDSNNMEGYYGDYITANFGYLESSHVKLLVRSDVKPGLGGIFPYSFPENKSDGGLVVAIKNNNGTWTNISQFYPRALWYTDAFILDPYMQNASQPLEIYIGWHEYHKLDWIAIDATEDVSVNTHIYAPVKAESNGEDVLDTLLHTDNENVSLVPPKQNITVEFPYEKPKNDTVRDLVFISRGRYDTIPRTENIGFDVYQYVKMSVRMKGKPGNTVNINILEDGKKIGNFSITREHRNPADNIKNFSFRKHIGREYELELVNEGRKGCNPVEITFISVFSGRNETIKERAKAGTSEKVAIDSTLSYILTGEKAFFFEIAPPYYDVPSSWISEINWDFGDDESGMGPMPIHFYPESGEYNVTMTIKYTDDLEVSLTRTIEISEDLSPSPSQSPSKQDSRR